MTHFTVTVAIPADTPAHHLYGALSAALEPFSENLDVEPYVKLTAAQIAADSEFQAFWAKLKDDNPRTLLSFAEATSDWFGGELREDGNLWSTWNRDGHWDWWVIGGRWAGEWLLTPGAQRALEPERSSFGFTEESADPRRTDAAPARARSTRTASRSATPTSTSTGSGITRAGWAGLRRAPKR